MKKTIAFISAVIMTVSAAALPVSAAEWVKTDNGYVYQLDNGKNAPKGWLTVGKSKYYINADGTRKTGWLEIQNEKYYFGKDGKMYKSKWLTFKDGTKYYIKSNGKCASGWLKLSDRQYYFSKEDNHMCTGITFINGARYNFNSKGIWDGKAGVKYLDFRNGNWEDSYKTISAKETLTKLKDGLYYGKNVSIGDYSYLIYYTFDSKDKLYKGEYILNDDDSNIFDSFSCYLAYNEAIETFTAKYGNPTEQKINYYYDTSLGFWDAVMIGAASAHYTWETDRTTISLRFMDDDDATPSVYIVYSSKNYNPTITKKVPNTTNV